MKRVLHKLGTSCIICLVKTRLLAVNDEWCAEEGQVCVWFPRRPVGEGQETHGYCAHQGSKAEVSVDHSPEGKLGRTVVLPSRPSFNLFLGMTTYYLRERLEY